MKALITAGGTSEPIDDVRVVTNLSRGRFGAAIANALVARGVEVTLLASKALMAQEGWVDPRVQRVPFGSFADLARALRTHTETPPDLLFMAAAVSDYSPVPTEGKIRSTSDDLVIHMKRNPKLLSTLRERCGVGTFLVGFKLLSGVTREQLVEVARGQQRKARLNLTVANDLQTFAPGVHPIVLVTPEGGAIPHRGSKDEVAVELVDFVLKRAAVTWCRTEPAEGVAPPVSDEAAALLATAIDANLLTEAPDGNVSHRTDAGLVTTPRQVPKNTVGPDDLVHVWPDLDARLHTFSGAKPSIDSTVAAWLYARLPRLNGLVHFHDALAIPTARTAFPYPCGCVEEAEEVHRALTAAAVAGRYTGGDFLVQLTEHGWLLGLANPAAFEARWARLSDAHAAHLTRLGGTLVSRTPVFDGGAVVGVWAELETVDGTAHTLWLDPETRGSGIGDRLSRVLSHTPVRIVVHDDCAVRDFWIGRGFVPVAEDGPRTVLASPELHPDVRQAASVCLVDPVQRTVLLGKRGQGAYLGYWAFPGGGLEPWETHEEAGDRELFEETHVRRPDVPLLVETSIHVGDGQRVWRVLNRAYATLSKPAPVATAEMDAAWIDLDTALDRTPMASGTRTVLRAVLDRLS